MASAAPGRSLTFPGSCRNPGSSTIVPSRSRKTAGLATQRGNDHVDLIGLNRARIEQDAIARDARNDGRIERAQLCLIGVWCRVPDTDQPGLELGSWEGSTTDFGIPFDQLSLVAHAVQ